VNPEGGTANTATLERITVVGSRGGGGDGDGDTGITVTASPSHGGSPYDYLNVDEYSIGATSDAGPAAEQGQPTTYQQAMDAAAALLNKPQGAVTRDDVLGVLGQIREARANPGLSMREQQGLSSMFMAIYTRGNTERVIDSTFVPQEMVAAVVGAMAFGGSVARVPRQTSPTGPMLPGTTGNRTAISNIPPLGEARFVSGVVVVDRATGRVSRGTVDIQPTLDRIQNGVRYPHRNDGSTYRNDPPRGGGAPALPIRPQGYYTEYVVPTPGINGPGPQRLVIGQAGEIYFTPDHYATFTRLR
jgi:guanyl-specific ribonuclease Sa